MTAPSFPVLTHLNIRCPAVVDTVTGAFWDAGITRTCLWVYIFEGTWLPGLQHRSAWAPLVTALLSHAVFIHYS